MNAGLPTTGIGGIFYFLSVVLMLLFEITLTIRGRSSFLRWKFVSGQLALLLAIFAVVTASWIILERLIPEQTKIALTPFSSNASFKDNSQAIFFSPLLILASLLALNQVIYLFLRLSKK